MNFNDFDKRDELIRQALENYEVLSRRYDQGKVDTLGFFEELGKWTRDTSEMLIQNSGEMTARAFNALSLVEEKKAFLEDLLNNTRKRWVLS